MIVEAFDPVNDVESRFGASCVSKLIDTFDLQCLEEALHRRVVPAIGPAAHRLQHPEISNQLPVAITRVLAAAVRMQDQPRPRFAAPIGGLQRLADQIGVVTLPRFHVHQASQSSGRAWIADGLRRGRLRRPKVLPPHWGARLRHTSLLLRLSFAKSASLSIIFANRVRDYSRTRGPAGRSCPVVLTYASREAVPAIYANLRSDCPNSWPRPSARRRGRSTLQNQCTTGGVPVSPFPGVGTRARCEPLHFRDAAVDGGHRGSAHQVSSVVL